MKNERVNYVDPGTGGLIVSSFWSVIVAIITVVSAFFLKHFIRPLKKILLRAWAFKKWYYVPLIAILLIISASYIGNNRAGERMTKVLVIGIDALDTNITEQLMDEGKLPNFKRLKETGSYARLETMIPPESPVAWTAAATGVNPGKYGIFDFIGRDTKTYMPKLTLFEEHKELRGTAYISSQKGTPFWRIASEQNIPATVIRWPVTFPPEKINGKMLSGLGTVDIRGFSNSYSFYTTDKEKKSGDVGRLVIVEKDAEIETKLFGSFVRKGTDIIESEIPMNIKLNSTHVILHVNDIEYNISVNNWSDWIKVKFKVNFLTSVYGIFRVYVMSTEPEFNMYITSIQIDPENQIIPITYPKDYGKELVKSVGLFATLGIPEDTKAVTEGKITRDIFLEQIKQIEDERTKMFWYEFNRFNNGVYAFAFDAGDRLQHIFWDNKEIPRQIEDYYTEKDRLIGKVMDKIGNNTALILFSDHGFTSFERAVNINTWLVENGYMVLTHENNTGSLFKNVDWNNTSAYSLGFSSVYINMKGREGNGIVGSEKNILINEIITKLQNMTDMKTGKKVITAAYNGDDIYTGIYTHDAPDIIIGFEPGYRMSWQNALGGVTEEVIMNNTQAWIGDHLVDYKHVPGILFTNFRINTQHPNIMDIAPTILSLLNLESKNMDGKSLVEP